MSNEKDIAPSSEYEYGFHDEDVSVYKTQKGLNEETVRTISKIKNEPEWMLQLRLDAYHSFENQQNPNWGPDLSEIDFDDYTESIPAYIGIIAMPFMYSISEGISLGIISYVVINLVCGKAKEKKISPLLYILAVLFVLKYIML